MSTSFIITQIVSIVASIFLLFGRHLTPEDSQALTTAVSGTVALGSEALAFYLHYSHTKQLIQNNKYSST
jgi:uncharacterized protein (DUF697 family)